MKTKGREYFPGIGELNPDRVAQGMDKVGLKDKPVIGIIGDSTFFHSGITGLLELSYNKGISYLPFINKSFCFAGSSG